MLSHPHFLLVTLVLCNAAATEVGLLALLPSLARCTAAMRQAAWLGVARHAACAACRQALPIFLDRLVDPVTAVLISITVVLIFGGHPFIMKLTG